MSQNIEKYDEISMHEENQPNYQSKLEIRQGYSQKTLANIYQHGKNKTSHGHARKRQTKDETTSKLKKEQKSKERLETKQTKGQCNKNKSIPQKAKNTSQIKVQPQDFDRKATLKNKIVTYRR